MADLRFKLSASVASHHRVFFLSSSLVGRKAKELNLSSQISLKINLCRKWRAIIHVTTKFKIQLPHSRIIKKFINY